MLLAIDTSAGTSVALLQGLDVIAECATDDVMRHAEIVGELIRECLETGKVQGSEIEFVACGMGPGPFTGLRVGIAAARGFAVGSGARIIPVVSHEALAAEFYAGQPDDHKSTPLTVVTDARRHEVYWSGYSGVDENGMPIRAAGPALAKPDELDAAAFNTSDFDMTGSTRFDAHEVSAGWVGRLAMLRLEYSYPDVSNEALYLRSPDVTLSNGPKRVSQ